MIPTPIGLSWGHKDLQSILNLCEEKGIDWTRTVCCHVGTTPLKVKRELLYRGASLCFECGQCFALSGDPAAPMVASDECIASEILELSGEGGTNQLLVSQGVCMRTMTRAGGGVGYDHLEADFIPRLQRILTLTLTLTLIG